MVGFVAAQYGVAIKRAKTEDEYFNSEDEPEEAPAYQPKPGSPGPGNAPGTYDSSCVADPWHFGTDPDPQIRTSD